MLYDKYIVCFSGGKDCTAALLNLLDQKVPVDRIELWHHEVDGREGSKLMDWPCTPGYCQAFADAFGIPLFFSWKEGGFEREMLRHESLTAPTKFENIAGNVVTIGGKTGKRSTRLKFPQVAADLKVRWCSGYLKRDVYELALRNQSRFNGKTVLVITGERAEESSARANYAEFEIDRTDTREGKTKRHVDRSRPVKLFKEKQVWEIIERYKVRVHPCYYLGWARCSCRYCIFGSANQMASAYLVAPEQGERLMDYEDSFGYTMKRNTSLRNFIAAGTPYASITPELIEVSNSKTYTLPIFMDEWVLPAGAYGESCGPS